MFKSYKYRLLPTKEQEKILVDWQGQMRFIWNKFLEVNIKKYEAEKKFIFIFDLKKMIPDMKGQYSWINAPSQSLQEIAFRMDKALRSSFKNKTKRFGFPKFKKKGHFESGIKIPQNTSGKQICMGPKFIKIPKLGEIKWIRHREIEGKLKSITITRDVDQWYVSCLCDIDFVPITKEVKSIENDITAIDLGIKNFIVDSNGVIVDSPKFLRKSEQKLKRKQRQYSRKQKGSKNQEKAKLKVAKLHRKIRKQRSNFLHKMSCQIANENSIVICEDLAVKNMVRNYKLARAISDQGWSQFLVYLSYKLDWSGGKLIKIGRFSPSSQLCSKCGNKQKMPLDIRTYVCSNCDLSIDRDLNAALNIKAFGLEILSNTEGTSEIYACRDTSIKDQVANWSEFVSMKQEAARSLEPQWFTV